MARKGGGNIHVAGGGWGLTKLWVRTKTITQHQIKRWKAYLEETENRKRKKGPRTYVNIINPEKKSITKSGFL